jgi:hypothetical protein
LSFWKNKIKNKTEHEINNQTYMTCKDIQEEVKSCFSRYNPNTLEARPGKYLPRAVDSQNSWYILQDNNSSQEIPCVKKFRACLH